MYLFLTDIQPNDDAYYYDTNKVGNGFGHNQHE